jgi:hypothetical protein
MDERFLHFERPASAPMSGKRRMLAAIAVMAFALVPVFMLFLALVASIMTPSKIGSYSEEFFGALPEMLLRGLVAGVPLALFYAALLSLLARWKWDAIGVSLATGIALSLVLEFSFVAIGMPDTSPGIWDLFLLLLPFAGTSALMCAIYWRMVIRCQRLARLAAKQAADAIRAMD